MIMGGVRSKVLVAILKKTSVSMPPPQKLPWNFCPQWGGGTMDIFWNYTIQKNVISPHKRLFDAYYF